MLFALAVLSVSLSSTYAEPPPLADPPAPSETGGEAGHGHIGFRLGYYNNDDSGDGNPFLDESLTVIEPIFVFDYNLTNKLALNGTFSFDSVSSASIDRLSRYSEQSGASGDTFFGLNLGTVYKISDVFRIGGHGSFSSEYDYQSLGAGLFLARDLADRNAILKWDVSGFLDTIDVIRFDGSEDGSDDRTSLSTGLTWYQIVSPKTHFELGGVVSSQSGFLETPYNAVVIEDSSLPPNPALENLARGREVTEVLPDTRVRTALFGRVRRSLSPLTAVEFGSRVYTDTWGITSFSFEPALHRWLVEDLLKTRMRYRYYTQTAADDFSEHFSTEPSERTQDSDLGDFSAHAVGVRFDWYATKRWRFDIGADYTMRSDGIDQLMASLGFTWEF
ncbi:MAG: DUF3570 domain-containing protein [Planctomycetota bacterium]